MSHSNLMIFFQGWAGFAFPSLRTALQGFRDLDFRPSNQVGLALDGNTAHSSGWWWYHAAPFYIGGSLYYNGNTMLDVEARSFLTTIGVHAKSTAATLQQLRLGDEVAWLQMSNKRSS